MDSISGSGISTISGSSSVSNTGEIPEISSFGAVTTGAFTVTGSGCTSSTFGVSEGGVRDGIFTTEGAIVPSATGGSESVSGTTGCIGCLTILGAIGFGKADSGITGPPSGALTGLTSGVVPLSDLAAD